MEEYMAIRTRYFGILACAAALFLLAFATSIAKAGTVATPQDSSPSITQAIVRLAVIPGRPAAGYANITGGSLQDRLLAVEIDGAARAELHETSHVDGVMKMRRLDALVIPSNRKVLLRAGGLHLMIFGLPDMTPGQTIPMRFLFENAGTIEVVAIARASN